MRKQFHTGWEALVWKEWRQQRLAALLLGLFCLLGYLGYCRAMKGDPEPTSWVLLLVLASGCLGASVFAGESDDRTAGFLGRLPVSPWWTVLTKYGLALGLAGGCLLVPALLMRPDLGEAFAGTSAQETWGQVNPLLGSALAASVVVALAGALAGSGLGAMATMLTAALAMLGSGSLLVVSTRLSYFSSSRAMGLGTAILVAWGLAHVWLVRTWAGRRQAQGYWRPLVWAGAVVLVPATSQIVVQVGDRLLMRPGRPVCEGEAAVIPSPAGHLIALSTWRKSASYDGAWQSWLLDADTGKWCGVGAWYRDCRFPAWNRDTTCWSPDGRWIRLQSSSVFSPAATYDEYCERLVESVWRVEGASMKPVRRWHRSRSASARWLGDGLMTTHADDAWEFRNVETATLERCLHPPQDASIKRQWQDVQKLWLDHEIASIHVDDPNADGMRICRYWRTAPDLACTERRDFALPEGVPSGTLYPTPSRDGTWVFLSTSYYGGGDDWLLSLVDGTCLPLGKLPETLRASPSFTPDSNLLIVPKLDSLDVWNVGLRRWDPPIPLPPVTLPPRLAPFQLNSIAAVSPAPPWRVVVSIGCSDSIHVADLATRNVSEVFSTPLPQEYYTWGRDVAWFGNDRLLVRLGPTSRLLVVNADGSGSRQVLP